MKLKLTEAQGCNVDFGMFASLIGNFPGSWLQTLMMCTPGGPTHTACSTAGVGAGVNPASGPEPDCTGELLSAHLTQLHSKH